MTFFYDLNKRMAALATKQNLAEGKSAKPDFLDIDGDGNKKETMKKAVADKASKKEVDESALQAYIGNKKYGEQGMKALQQAGRDGVSKEKMSKIRTQYNKMDEDDMDEGNEFSGELVKARAQGAKEFEVDGKTYPVKEAKAKKDKPKNVFDPEVARKMFEPEKGTGKFDKKQISTGTVYTRRYEEEPDEDEDERTTKSLGVVRKKGRKEVGAGKGKKIGAKSRGTSKLASKGSIAEGTIDDIVTAARILGKLMGRSEKGETIEPKELAIQLRQVHQRLSRVMGGSAVDTLRPETKPMAEDGSIPLVDKGEYDREGEMAKQQMHTIMRAAKQLHSMLGDDENLPEWVQKKITLAQNYIDGVSDYMTSVDAERQEQPIAEKAVSKDQAVSARIARAVQKGEAKAEPGTASAEMAKMQPKELKKFAKTDTKDLPKKVKEEEATPKAKNGIEFGKGVYESLNSKLENMITEGMNVSVNMSTNEHGELTKNITVSAEGAEAESLAQLLNLAGMKSSSCGCGQSPCGCSQMEESYGDTEPTKNTPDYPTQEETIGADDELLRRFAGGLNKPKSTGQTTVPVVASQQDRLHTMEETKADKLGMNLYAELQSYKVK